MAEKVIVGGQEAGTPGKKEEKLFDFRLRRGNGSELIAVKLEMAPSSRVREVAREEGASLSEVAGQLIMAGYPLWVEARKKNGNGSSPRK
jgi:hypothetical protein